MVQRELRKTLEGGDTEDIRQPNAVYKFEGATVRVYGNCSNIRAETEKFLKRVIHIRKNEGEKHSMRQSVKKDE